MPDEPVDVLIVGAGAAGAALACSLAETRMNILCLEQGDWMDPGQYPTTGMDWEMRRFHDFGRSPNTRLMGVAGLGGDRAYPPKELPLPPVPLGRLGETLARGFDAKGWHWWPSAKTCPRSTTG